jgi:prepilin signal peptidase PulO-like enzyme (type II secretory pathway)
MKERTTEHVFRGIRLALGMVAGICTIGLLAYGFNKLHFPAVDNSLFGSLKDYPARAVGGVCVAISLVILVSTVNRWIKMLPGLFAYAALGGLLAVADGGFHSRIASQQLNRAGAGVITALLAVVGVEALAALAAIFAVAATLRFGRKESSVVSGLT